MKDFCSAYLAFLIPSTPGVFNELLDIDDYLPTHTSTGLLLMEATSYMDTKNVFSYTPDEVENVLFPLDSIKAFVTETAQDILKEIIHLRKKKTDLELHGQSLSEYYRQKRIPRGFWDQYSAHYRTE